ncbi:nudix hydrolase 20, chloroplastic-like isoform X1 [Ipomoea triloba]|uniref:nudix hydrolase 20, chloroplastic-like isoform X1 n=2 Tax=Ipomoea triloba TaxID=35885 RepID=UPI00125D17C0|nr:nudix hydrolase 20, chloroplastic-like isoform X1 [Ipomoea triloba]XP_031109390.1 nudix hydrolase 20, chloroplastic-like isoform X1 [Ipomoea triloba]XP_031109391.1 nudix hydrolase 20, chloroplastic-like isoform X1 [Ipomoea triloba]
MKRILRGLPFSSSHLRGIFPRSNLKINIHSNCSNIYFRTICSSDTSNVQVSNITPVAHIEKSHTTLYPNLILRARSGDQVFFTSVHPNLVLQIPKNSTMASHLYCHHFSQKLSFPSFLPKTNSSFTLLPTISLRYPCRPFAVSVSSHGHGGGGSGTISFTWDDVSRLSNSPGNHSSDLQGFFDKVKLCNRNSEKKNEFMPFVMENQIVGYVHNGFADHLRAFRNVFVFPKDNSYGSHFGCHVTLHPLLKTPEDRTAAFAEVVKSLGEELIPGIRNELYPVVSSFGTSIFFSMERAAAPYFGIKAYGVHMNGYVESNGQKFLWIGKRSEEKSTFPGMLDHLVAGGLPHGISCGENLVKECKEEAGIPESFSTQAIPVGAVSYMDIDRYRFKRDVLFCYDLKLPESFIPSNEDGEVESFRLVPISEVANIIRRTSFFKTNCNVVIIDFLIRHGYIKPEEFGYLELLQSLRSGDCS